MIADLACGHEELERAALGIRDGMHLGVHSALGPADQASTPPFFDRRLVAVRWTSTQGSRKPINGS